MITVPAGMRVLVATKPVDFAAAPTVWRWCASNCGTIHSRDDLHLPIEAGGPPEDPGLGRSGLVLFWKRLEQGTFGGRRSATA